MLLLSHTITGAVIGQKTGDPIVISLIALISHFILDRIPHWNYLDQQGHKEYNENEKFHLWKYIEAVPDIITTLLVYFTFLFCFPDKWLEISLGVGFAILPDFLTLSKYIPYIKSVFRPLNKLHYKIQGRIKKYHKAVVGLAIQILYICLLMTIFIYL